jgi:hypothetical protein
MCANNFVAAQGTVQVAAENGTFSLVFLFQLGDMRGHSRTFQDISGRGPGDSA